MTRIGRGEEVKWKRRKGLRIKRKIREQWTGEIEGEP